MNCDVLRDNRVLVLWCRPRGEHHADYMAKQRVRLPAAGFGRARWAVFPSAVALALAAPVATWWLVGDLSTVPASSDPDHAFQPWPMSPAAARTVGIGSLTVAATATALLGWATARRHLDVRWWAVLVPLMTAGFIAGAGWRVMTAGVIGANIGAGFVVLLGGPVVLGLLIWAVGFSVHLLRARTPAANSQTKSRDD